jgi:hypothetical protein
MRTHQPSSEWTEKLLKSIQPHLLKGDYQAGLVKAKRGLKEYPDSFVALYQYAKLLGDWADELPELKQKKYKREAAGILKKLTKRMAGQPTAMRFGACLNYYYQAFAYREMYAFGARFMRHDERKAYYARALAAGLLAEQHYVRDRKSAAAKWAKKSIRAWQKYGLKDEKYYFAHYSYAKALAIAKDEKSAMRSLKMAARLSQRPITDWEFRDVMMILNGEHAQTKAKRESR